MKKKPSEKVSRGVVGEILAPSSLPPALAALARDWEPLTYDEKVADAKQRPIADLVQMLQTLGGTFKNAIQLVREFLPLLEACRDELSQPGRRVPLDGRPTWTEFVTTTFGFSVRRMQQLLSDGNQSPRSSQPATRRDKRRSGSDSADERTEQIAPLALKLARRVVELGLAAQLPEADAILDILDATRKSPPFTDRASAESHLVPAVPDSNKPLLLTLGVRPDEGPEAVRGDNGDFHPLPNCYVCGTGIEFCRVHEPQHKKLMAEGGLDDLDAADLLKDRYAKRIQKFSNVA